MKKHAKAGLLHRIPDTTKHLREEHIREDAIRTLTQDKANGPGTPTDKGTSGCIGIVVQAVSDI
jgi:hypothetical protein